MYSPLDVGAGGEVGLELVKVDGHCVECRGDESGERVDIDLKFYGDRERSLGQADEISASQTCP